MANPEKSVGNTGPEKPKKDNSKIAQYAGKIALGGGKK